MFVQARTENETTKCGKFNTITNNIEVTNYNVSTRVPSRESRDGKFTGFPGFFPFPIPGKNLKFPGFPGFSLIDQNLAY
jgi:hypothetical protein